MYKRSYRTHTRELAAIPKHLCANVAKRSLAFPKLTVSAESHFFGRRSLVLPECILEWVRDINGTPEEDGAYTCVSIWPSSCGADIKIESTEA